MNDQPDSRSHSGDSNKPRCLVCGSTECRGAGAHAHQKMYLEAMYEVGADVRMSYDPIESSNGDCAGYCLMASWVDPVTKKMELDTVFVSSREGDDDLWV